MYTPIPIKRSTHYGNNYWEAFSLKMKRNVRLFSDLEYDHWILIETDPNVKQFCEQPLRIQHYYDGERVESIYDMWIEEMDGTEYFVEVKYAHQLDPTNRNSKRAIRQTSVQKAWCTDNGKNHKIATDKEIRANRVLLSNQKILLSYLRNRMQPIETDLAKVLRELKSNSQPLPLSKLDILLASQLSNPRIREAICWLVYNGIIQTNMISQPFGPMTEVYYHA